MNQIHKMFLIGLLAGAIIGNVIGIMFSMFSGTGLCPVSDQLILDAGSETSAIVVQTIISAVLGAIIFGTTFVYDLEGWSIAKSTLVHSVITFCTFVPSAYALYWMDRSAEGIALYLVIIVAIYVSIWLSQYLSYKSEIKKINDMLKKE